MDFFETLRNRISERSEKTLSVRRFIVSLEAVSDHFTNEKNRLAADAKLSSVGRRDELRSFATKHTAAAIGRTRRAIDDARANIAARRERLQPRVSDPKDIPAALMRASIATWWLSRTQSERMQTVVDPALDARIMVAVADMPAAMRGVPDKHFTEAVERFVERTHPDEVRALADDENTLDVVNAAARYIEVDLMKSLEVAAPAIAAMVETATIAESSGLSFGDLTSDQKLAALERMAASNMAA
jgi:hypothetical protein